MRLKDKTAFSTGGGSGLGRAAAERFSTEGATVIAADIDYEGAKETAESICGDAIAHELDVRDFEAFRDAIDTTVD